MAGALATTKVDQATLLRKHYSFQQGCFITAHEEIAGGIVAFSNVTPTPIWNHATWLRGNSEAFEAFLHRAPEWQRQKQRQPVLYIADPSTEQEAAIRQAGFEKFDEEAWLVCDVAQAEHSIDPDVREVSDPDTLKHFIDTFYTSFQIKEVGYRSILASNPEATARSRHFVLYDEEQRPVSVGTLVTDGSLGCIYNVATPPIDRKKGYGRRIFEHIAAAGRQAGCDTLYLQVENRSVPMRLYKKCGFEVLFVRTGYRLADWRPPQPDRTKLSNALGYRSPKDTPAGQYLRETRALPASILESNRTAKPTANPAGNHVFIAAWAYLLHRYTGEEVVEFTVCEHTQGSRRGIAVTLAPEKDAREWIADLATVSATSAAGARESLLCLSPEHSANHLGDHEFPIEIHVLDASQTLEIVFRRDLFSKDSIRRMATHFTVVLEELCNPRARKVSEIEILSSEEKHQLLVEWNQAHYVPVRETIAHLFESRVERTPDSSALLFAKAGQSVPVEQITYRQLNRKANRLAHQLQEFGVGPEVFVGICLERSPELIVAMLAILKAGGACVPLDPAYPVERLRFMVHDTNAPVILTQRSLLPILRDATHARIICLDEPSSVARADSERNLASNRNPDAAAYIIYTSGSTGTPKGVVITNNALANHSLDCCSVYGLSTRDRILQFSSLNFDAAFEQIFPALISGACLVMRDDEVWNVREFADKLRDFQLTVTDIPTAYWHQLATEWAANPAAVPNHCLRLVIVGGEALSAEKLALWHRTPLAHVRLINAYGPTEATITATSFAVPPPGTSDSNYETVPIGRLRADRKLYVLDRHGNPTPIGVPGELHIGGSLLARGYHRRPDLSAERFIANPFSDEPDARLYRTGDLVRFLNDGNLEFLGRIDDQVKIRGFRIELGEIESCLRKNPSVRDALVVAKANSSGEKQLVAYIVRQGDLNASDVRSYLRGKLPEYMLPARFVLMEQWPLLPNGKVNRLALPEPSEEPANESVRGPEDPLELQLQLLFERVLKRAPISVDVSFFELGGDSLQALELLVEIEKSTGRQLPLGTLYQSSTVQSLAHEVRTRATQEEWSSLVPLQVSGKRPPLFLLHTTPGDILGYGNLVYRLNADQPCYGFQSLGLKEAALSHLSIPEMAKYYTSLLRQFQPRGPYYLGGWCYGGIVAVEMARLLKNQGEEIALLALLETVAVPAPITNWRYYAHRFQRFLAMSPRRWITYFRAKARYARQSRIANKMRFRQADNADDGGPRDPRLIQLEHVYNTNLRALEGYKSEFYDGKVTLFNAAQKDSALIPDPYYAWVGLAREIEIHEVPGDHDTMLTEPNVSDLARVLNECLVRAQRLYEGKTEK